MPQNISITVNSNGAFFTAGSGANAVWQVGVNNYQGGTLQAQATILIHELAHLFEISGFKPDFGNAAAGHDNDKAVDKNCGSLIKALK